MITKSKSERGKSRKSPRKGRSRGDRQSAGAAPRKGRPLPPDFVGLVDERGEVIVDDTNYVRHQRALDAARKQLEEATAPARARLLELIAAAETERRSAVDRLGYQHELEHALHTYERAIVDHIIKRDWEAKNG